MNDQDPSFRSVLSLNPAMVRGPRGIVILGCAIVGVASINCLVWVVPPPNLNVTATHPILPPGTEHLLPLSIIAIALVALSLMTMAFIPIWTTISPPRSDARSFLIPIVIVLILGFLAVVPSGHAHIGLRF
jgi:hypothetical protein